MRIISRAACGLVNLASANLSDTNAHALSTDGTNALLLALLGTKRFNQKQFVVRASGYIKSHANSTFTCTLYWGTTSTTVKASTARALDGSGGIVYAPWMMEARLVFDMQSGLLHGTAGFTVNNLTDAQAAITAASGLVEAEPIGNFLMGFTASAGAADQYVYMSEFVLGF